MSLEPFDPHAADAQASLLMKRGIQLMRDPSTAAGAEALICFDAALKLRQRLPVEATPMFGYGLAACWLNRAEALTRISDPAQTSTVLDAYDRAISLLRALPLGDDPRFPRRLALAHQNRGLVLHATGPSRMADTIASFDEAIATLDREESRFVEDRQYLLAAVWMNLSNALAASDMSDAPARARDAALRAMSLVKEIEDTNPNAAEVGLKARHVVCQTVAASLSATPMPGTLPDDVHEATDAVDEGLALARRWESRGVIRFRDVAVDLFRFGSLAYRIYQPQFLDEYLYDHIDVSQMSLTSPEDAS
jgi:hypothetical protein